MALEQSVASFVPHSERDDFDRPNHGEAPAARAARSQDARTDLPIAWTWDEVERERVGTDGRRQYRQSARRKEKKPTQRKPEHRPLISAITQPFRFRKESGH